MLECQLARMQHRTLSTNASAGTTVLRIADHRMADGCEVHTNLVRATRLESAFEQGRLTRHAKRLFDCIMRARGATVDDHRHTRDVAVITPNRRINYSICRSRNPPNECGIHPGHTACSHLCHQRFVGRRCACHHHESRRAGVQSVHDARAHRIAG